jgi:hypothetical protein
MDYYMKSIPGTSSLVEINIEIRGQEVGYAQFVNSKIVNNDNIVTFDEDVSDIPKPLLVILATDPQPPKTTPGWNGDMLINGNKTHVQSYRRL